jgi:hypothetical protein
MTYKVTSIRRRVLADILSNMPEFVKWGYQNWQRREVFAHAYK